MQADATIFNGLPVMVEYHLEQAQPDVGIMLGGAEIDEIYISRIRKDGRETCRPIPSSWWDRLIKSGELAQLEETLSEEAYF